MAAHNRKTKEKFVAQAELIVPAGRYDFSGTVYTTGETNTRVKCNIHGYFVTTPNRILKGSGCPQCGVIKRAATIASGGIEYTTTNKAYLLRATIYNFVMSAFDYKALSSLMITGCGDPLMWYAGRVGETCEVLAYMESKCGYMTREPSGLVNFVRYEDAKVVFKGVV